MMNQERLLSTKEAARFLGMSESFLERDRWEGADIPFIRVGKRSVRYKLSVLEAYVSSNVRSSTSV